MAADTLTDRTRTLAQLGALLAAELSAHVSPRRLLRFTPPSAPPDRMLVPPKPIFEGDRARGAILYGGTFNFVGHAVDAGGASIFMVTPPSPEWERALHGFGWLADLVAADNTLCRTYGRALIEDWAATGRLRRNARRPEVTARRLISWLAYAPFLLDGADSGFHRKFLRALGRQTSRLRRDIGRVPPGMAKLLSAIALTSAGLSLPESSRALRTGCETLNAELRRLVLPDGGVATRNPADLLALATDLLPLRQSFAERSIEAPRELLLALDRILPMLRFFRHADGTLGLFNGMGRTPVDLLETVAALDDTQGLPVLNAPFSGYQRLEGEGTVLIADTGRPPPLALSGQAHAGTLAFEFSSGGEKLIVNCGAANEAAAPVRLAARSTAGHSTATIGDTSSCRFLGGIARSILGDLVREGPETVEVAREDRESASTLRASHDGYAARFGFIHERTLRLHATGDHLEGMDVLRPVRQRTGAEAVLRFHLHPDVKATRLNDGRAILLVTASGDRWVFAAENHLADIEESVHFGEESGAQPAEQIAVYLGRKAGVRVSWSFIRKGRETAPAADSLA